MTSGTCAHRPRGSSEPRSCRLSSSRPEALRVILPDGALGRETRSAFTMGDIS